jgi:branched-chain amino acid transport system permease protein
LPLLLDPLPYWRRVINILCVYALLAISFDFLANCIGLVCLGGSMFIGLEVFRGHLQCPPAPSLYVSIPSPRWPSGGFDALILLPPCGVYFAIVTLMYPLLFTRVIEAFDLLGGSNGSTGLDSFPGSYLENYSILLVLLAVLFGLRRVLNADIGLVMHAVKDNDQSVRASGIDVSDLAWPPRLLHRASGAYPRTCMWRGCRSRSTTPSSRSPR